MVPRSSRALAACLAGLALAGLGAGCGGGQATTGEAAGQARSEEAVREGLFHDLAGLEYKVFITRQLNQSDPEDKAYFQGPEPPPGSTYYGVFIQVCNHGEEPQRSARSFKIVDTQGNEFSPTPLPASNAFAYAPAVLAPDACIPDAASIAGQAPTGGALVLFELPLEATENRPLELEVTSGYNAAGEPRMQAFELDI